MNKRIFFTIVLAMNVVFVMAQRLPNWVFNKPEPTNGTYLYVVESATGQTEIDARNRAIAEVMRTTAMIIGMPFDSEEISRALQSGTDYSMISARYDIPIHKVCEYVVKKETPCRVYILCQVAKAGNTSPSFDDFNSCYDNDNYYGEDALYVVDNYYSCVYRNGRELYDGEIRTMFANTKSYHLYDSGKSMESRVSGEGLMGSLMLAGSVAILTYNRGGEEDNSKLSATIFGIVIGGSGLGLIVKGVVDLSLGKARIREAVDLYNGRTYSQNNLEFKYGLTGNGIYLSFSF